MKADFKDYLHMHFIVFIWGFTAILGLLITIPAVEVVFYRTLFAAIALLPFLFYRRLSLKVGWRETLKIIGTGCLIAAHWILFFASARVSNASICLAGMATASFWTSLVEPWFYRRKTKGFEVFLGLIVIAGLYVIFKFEFNHFLGLSMALGSALLAAIFSVINSKLTKKHSPYVITFYEMASASLSTALFFPLYTMYLAPDQSLHLALSGMDFLYILLLATVCTVYAFSASVELMKKISPFTMNLTVNLEPVYGIILAVIIFGESEKMAPGFYMGTVIILLAVLSYPIVNRINKRKALELDNLR
ncbi:MAG TPA: EamA family transporter [Cytophagales bacterium]|jgi:drug/metabolite transporter (DMT)-like permease|nr:EamA family transporter [Cytophagales bacterium]